MSKIIVQPLISTIEQTVSIWETHNVARIMLGVYKSLNPTGSFKVEIIDSDSLVIASKTQTIVEMQTAGSTELSSDYYHGFISWIFDRPVFMVAGTYTIKLSATDYTYSESTHIAWMKDWDNKVTNNSGTATTDFKEPYITRFYSYKRY